MNITINQIRFKKIEELSFNTQNITVYTDKNRGIVKHAIVIKKINGAFANQINKYFLVGVKTPFYSIHSLLNFINNGTTQFSHNLEKRAHNTTY
jgi:hypothetical protein